MARSYKILSIIRKNSLWLQKVKPQPKLKNSFPPYISESANNPEKPSEKPSEKLLTPQKNKKRLSETLIGMIHNDLSLLIIPKSSPSPISCLGRPLTSPNNFTCHHSDEPTHNALIPWPTNTDLSRQIRPHARTSRCTWVGLATP